MNGPSFSANDRAMGGTASVAPTARLGTGCVLDGPVRLDDAVQLGAGVLVSGPAVLETHACVGAGARLMAHVGADARLMAQPAAPSSEPEALLRVQRGAHIEAGALVLGPITIGAGAVVRAGAVVTQSVPPHAVVAGAPARITGYVGADAGADVGTGVGMDVGAGQQVSAVLPAGSAFAGWQADQTVRTLHVGQGERAVQLHRLKRVQDMRGDLSVGEFAQDIPFEAQRYFLVYNVPSEHTRGAHAHKLCHQFLICVAGSCAVVVDDGHQRLEVELNAPHLGLYMPPMIWGTQYKYSPGAVLLVYASHRYDPDDYIREYGQFSAMIHGEIG